jgi:hypothetical protein
MPANPRKASVGETCSRRESPQIPAQPASAMTGLSRRRSRVESRDRPMGAVVDADGGKAEAVEPKQQEVDDEPDAS